MEIKYEGIMSLQEFIIFNKAIGKISQRWRIFLLIFIIFGLFEFIYWFGSGMVNFYFIGIGCLINIVIFFTYRANAKNIYAQFIDKYKDFKLSFTFTENSVHIEEQSQNHVYNAYYRYSGFEKVVLSQNCLMLFIMNSTAYVVGSQRLVQGTFDDTIQLLKRNCKNFIDLNSK